MLYKRRRYVLQARATEEEAAIDLEEEAATDFESLKRTARRDKTEGSAADAFFIEECDGKFMAVASYNGKQYEMHARTTEEEAKADLDILLGKSG